VILTNLAKQRKIAFLGLHRRLSLGEMSITQLSRISSKEEKTKTKTKQQQTKKII
jgi:hypothetical protein